MFNHNASNNEYDEQNPEQDNETTLNEAGDDDYDEDNWYNYLMKFTKQQLYNLSGIEKLKPPEKKPKLVEIFE